MTAIETAFYIGVPSVLATTTAVRAIRDDRSDGERRAFGAFTLAFVALAVAGVGLATGALMYALASVIVAAIPTAAGFAFYYRERTTQGARA